MHRLGLLVLLSGCSKPAATTPKAGGDDEPMAFAAVPVSCDYGYGELSMYSPPSHQADAPIVHAHETARAHHGAGTQAIADRKPLVAATEFMACARAYAGIETADRERGLAQKSAEQCVADATYAYATAGKFAAVGKADLEKLAAEDPRLAAAVQAHLAKPPTDCDRPLTGK